MKNVFRALRFWETNWWKTYRRSWKSPVRDEGSQQMTRAKSDDSELLQKLYLHKPGDFAVTFP